MTDRAADIQPLQFGSFAELRRWHSAKLRHARAGGPITTENLRAYVHAVAASGTGIEAEDERQAAQDMLDYWFAELVSAAPSENQSWSPPRLAEFALPEGGGGTPRNAPDTATDAALAGIRLAAAARLWRDTGYKRGYLLFGQALADAKRVGGDDPDVVELIRQSEAYEQELVRRRRALTAAAVSAALTVVAVLFFILWQQAQADAARAEAARENADEQRREAEQGLARNMAKLDASLATDALNIALIRWIRQEIAAGRVVASTLPETVWNAVTYVDLPCLYGQQAGALSTGYSPRFTQPALAMPTHPGAGASLAYPNYSIVMHRTRRVAMVAAINVDRQQLRVLPRVQGKFTCDPRLSCEEQADPAWLDRDPDPNHLVARNLIAWGPVIQDLEPVAASQRLQVFLNCYPNIAQQSDAFNGSAVLQAGRWMLFSHNPSATRMSVFTGPVLRDDDPVVAGIPTPRRFWVIAASQGSTGLVVDAFMASQFKDGADEPAGLVAFDPDRLRVRVADIEQATGLAFDPALRQADALRAGVPKPAP